MGNGPVKTLKGILEAAKSFRPLRPAVAGADDVETLEAVKMALESGIIVEPFLIGCRKGFKDHMSELGLSDVCEAVFVYGEEKKCEAAVDLVSSGKADFLMKGKVHTAELLKAALRKEKGLRKEKLLSHVFIMEVKTYHKLLFVTDGAINILPDLEQKVAILNNALELTRALGVEIPKVAALSAVETVNPRIQSTIDAACLSKMAERGQIKGAIVDGPLAFDNAISKEAAEEKGIKSPVAGDPDILLLPNLESGNVLYKNLEYLAGAKAAGIVMGASRPISLTSRADPPDVKLYSVALAVLTYHQHHSSKFPTDEAACEVY